MKRIRLLTCLLITTLALGGCSISSDQFLSFHDVNLTQSNPLNNEITEEKFFAEDLAVIPVNMDNGGDAELTAEASLLVNTSDQKVIYADQVYEKLYPASITKLMTALVVLKYGELTDSVTISYNASHIPDPAAKVCGFKEGDELSLETLLNCLLIYSGNDAGIAIAEHVGGSEEDFVKKMNEEAKRIGAVHTNFVNSHGLHDENHYTTAYDIYLIFNELIEYDTFLSIINTSSYSAEFKDKDGNDKEKTFKNSNRYLSGETKPLEGINVIGGKTGTTYKAGNCLVLLCQDNNKKNYIAVILKASDGDSLYNQMSYLLSFMNKK